MKGQHIGRHFQNKARDGVFSMKHQFIWCSCLLMGCCPTVQFYILPNHHPVFIVSDQILGMVGQSQ